VKSKKRIAVDAFIILTCGPIALNHTYVMQNGILEPLAPKCEVIYVYVCKKKSAAL